MIFDHPPTTWQHLQALVKQAFDEMGCQAESPKTVELVRGKKEVDVWVQDNLYAIVTVYFIECKFWGTNVPQHEVHGFRTVVADGGAHRGIIIAKKGFQDGAYDATEKSNVDILGWEEFNQQFFQRWKITVAQELAALAQDVLQFSHSPFYRFKDRFKRRWNLPLAEGWAAIKDAGGLLAIAASRNILAELDGGPVKIMRPEFSPKSREEITEENMFLKFRTHREWYDYAKPRLLQWRSRIDEWYALYERQGGDATQCTSEVDDD